MVILRIAQAHGQVESQGRPAGCAQKAALPAGAQDRAFGLTQGTCSAQEEALVEGGRVVWASSLADECPAESADFQSMMPVAGAPRQQEPASPSARPPLPRPPSASRCPLGLEPARSRESVRWASRAPLRARDAYGRAVLAVFANTGWSVRCRTHKQARRWRWRAVIGWDSIAPPLGASPPRHAADGGASADP
jgi:hypothetical protein